MLVFRMGDKSKRSNENETINVTCQHCGKRMKIEPINVRTQEIFFCYTKYFFRCSECREWTRIRRGEMTPNFKSWVLYYDRKL